MYMYMIVYVYVYAYAYVLYMQLGVIADCPPLCPNAVISTAGLAPSSAVQPISYLCMDDDAGK